MIDGAIEVPIRDDIELFQDGKVDIGAEDVSQGGEVRGYVPSGSHGNTIDRVGEVWVVLTSERDKQTNQ